MSGFRNTTETGQYLVLYVLYHVQLYCIQYNCKGDTFTVLMQYPLCGVHCINNTVNKPIMLLWVQCIHNYYDNTEVPCVHCRGMCRRRYQGVLKTFFFLAGVHFHGPVFKYVSEICSWRAYIQKYQAEFQTFLDKFFKTPNFLCSPTPQNGTLHPRYGA